MSDLLGVSEDGAQRDRLRMQQWEMDRVRSVRSRHEAAQIDALHQQQEEDRRRQQAEQRRQDESRELLRVSQFMPRICESTSGTRFVVDRCKVNETDSTTHFALVSILPLALIVGLGMIARKTLARKW
jgi:hypothetical protein